MDIVLRAIELTVLGGFDKVTWDGASNSYPSVRIGGAQVLRTMDPKTGMHGEYLEWRIDELIAKRNEAAQDTFGKAASLLARLDQMYYEGSLNSAELQVRNDLYETLATKQPAEKDILDLLAKESNVETVQAVLDIKGDLDEPWTALANRLINRRHGKPSLLEECQGNQGDWSTFESILKRFLDRRAAGSGSSTNRGNTSTIEGDIHSFSMSPHWKRLNANYREWLKENAQKPENNEVVVEHYRGELDLNIKATPFENSDSPALADLKKHFKAYEVE
ncbi:unnamed protein product [Rhizoctonia solani]|uniref:Uncharacterized protein n=1 Tax=Rhizoctonia solani TaxID=456999 RepID=A0A8H3CSA4_9AGAM|nr:unnamed protein product [Rhizoctonia solani]